MVRVFLTCSGSESTFLKEETREKHEKIGLNQVRNSAGQTPNPTAPFPASWVCDSIIYVPAGLCSPAPTLCCHGYLWALSWAGCTQCLQSYGSLGFTFTALSLISSVMHIALWKLVASFCDTSPLLCMLHAFKISIL